MRNFENERFSLRRENDVFPGQENTMEDTGEILCSSTEIAISKYFWAI